MPAVALPAVGRPTRTCAADLIALAAFVAQAAAADVVHRHPVADLRGPDARSDRDDLTAGLVSRHHSGVGLGTGADVLAVDRADVAAADRRRPHRQHHLAVARRRIGQLAKLDGAVTG